MSPKGETKTAKVANTVVVRDVDDSDDEKNYHEEDSKGMEKHKVLMDESKGLSKFIQEALVKRCEESEDSPELIGVEEAARKRKASFVAATASKKHKTSSRFAQLSTTTVDASFIHLEEEPQLRSVAMLKSTDFDESFKSSKEGGIMHVPPVDMTGVSPILTRVCAAMSGQMYYAKKAADFDLDIPHHKVNVVLFDNHGKLAETTPPFVVAVTGKTMILGWRGSSTLMDWVMDFAFAPVASSRWAHTAKSVRAQGGYCALVESDLTIHEEFILETIKGHGITQLLLTGHSLAGGVAQVAHLFLEGEMSRPISPWKEVLSPGSIRTIAFSAPMTTVNINRKNDAQSAAFIKRVGDNMCNIVYHHDPVPRGYANLSFINSLVKSAIPELAEGVPIPRVLKWAVGFQGRIADAIEGAVSSQEELLLIAENFRHIGKIVHYEHAGAIPVVHIDKGFFYEKPEGSEQKLFYDLEYKEQDKVMESVKDHHNFLVTGPGLAYNVKREML